MKQEKTFQGVKFLILFVTKKTHFSGIIFPFKGVFNLLTYETRFFFFFIAAFFFFSIIILEKKYIYTWEKMVENNYCVIKIFGHVFYYVIIFYYFLFFFFLLFLLLLFAINFIQYMSIKNAKTLIIYLFKYEQNEMKYNNYLRLPGITFNMCLLTK